MPMARKIALVDYHKCHPEGCADGVCTAAQACKLKLLRQEEPYTPPMPDPFSCRACGDCVRACPRQAVMLAGQ